MRTALELGARPIFGQQRWQERVRQPKVPMPQAQASVLQQQEPGGQVWVQSVVPLPPRAQA